jgi:hypothetical protein
MELPPSAQNQQSGQAVQLCESIHKQAWLGLWCCCALQLLQTMKVGLGKCVRSSSTDVLSVHCGCKVAFARVCT